MLGGRAREQTAVGLWCRDRTMCLREYFSEFTRV